ncbi:MAG TPA: SpoIIE family protein phosphatase, partial [Gammaproteobacteria bacterium]
MAALPPSVPVCLKPDADTRPLALLVDDESFNLLLLQVLVEHLGYRAIKAENGAQAVERFAAQHPDIVLMDVTMPVMDGMEATRRIKQLAGDEHIPVIFVTALSDESELAACLAAGGDDFLSKPLSLTVLEAKIRAAERVRALQRAVNAHHNRLLLEQELARHVFAKVVEAGNSPIPGMQSLMRSADRFSGDLLLTGIGPDGSVTVLVGDFTGHGLAAALGALPATQIFRAMVAKGFDLTHIARELNQKLAGILPTGRFMAAVLARFTAGDRTCALLNSGLPDVLVVDGAGRVRQRWASQCIPLGIQSELDWDGPHWLTLEAGDWLVIATDGVSESVAVDGRPIGQSGFERILADGVPEQAVLRLERAFEAGRGEHPQTDDLTLLAL